MDSQEKDQRKPSQVKQDELYGQQGNQGQYGQGQYDSDGNPDLNGVQAQRIMPKPEKQKPQPQKMSYQSLNLYDYYQYVPHD